MGPPKPLPTSIVSPLPPAVGPKNGPDTTTGLPAASGGQTSVNGQSSPNPPGNNSDTTITTATPPPGAATSPFMNWVQQNPAAAAAAAQAERNSYQNGSSPAAAQDNTMLNIQYPYLWNQEQPPGGGSVIYTIKK
ncbi:MAG: hypothetical protein PW734_01875 [Verrucomicrobium sp.]|nr:hypothetical protein [Verrucomicrobium sp.]